MAAMDPGLVARFIRAAKQDDPIPFAFGAGASPEQSCLLVDKSKPVGTLLTTAKREAGKAFGGTVYCQGSDVTFHSDDAPSNATKAISDWFKANKLSLKPTVSAAPVAEEDDEDVEEGPALFAQAQVEKGLRRARKKPVNFAFALGRKPEDSLLAIHVRKKPEQLAMLARKESGSARGGFGTLSADGAKLAEFHCERDPPPGMRKHLRMLFRGWGLKTKVKIFGPDGEFVEAGDEEDDEDAAPAAATDAPSADDAALAGLRQRLQAVFADLKQLAKSDPARGDAARSGYSACEAAIKAGDAAEAGRQMDALDRLLAAAGSAPPGDGATDALKAELARLMPGLKEAAKLPDRTAPVREQWRLADTAIKGGDARGAEAAMVQLRELARLPAGEAGLAAALAAWAKRRAEYRDASELVDRQIAALQAVLRQSDDEDLEEIAEAGLNAVTGNFRVSMMAAMAEVDAASGPAFRTAAAKAMRNIEAFQDHIGSDERVEAVDENPFGVTVSIRETLGGALSGLRDALALAA